MQLGGWNSTHLKCISISKSKLDHFPKLGVKKSKRLWNHTFIHTRGRETWNLNMGKKSFQEEIQFWWCKFIQKNWFHTRCQKKTYGHHGSWWYLLLVKWGPTPISFQDIILSQMVNQMVQQLDRYRWWKKSCKPVEVGSFFPVIYKVLDIPCGAGFLPSTTVCKFICPSFFYQKMENPNWSYVDVFEYGRGTYIFI